MEREKTARLICSDDHRRKGAVFMGVFIDKNDEKRKLNVHYLTLRWTLKYGRPQTSTDSPNDDDRGNTHKERSKTKWTSQNLRMDLMGGEEWTRPRTRPFGRPFQRSRRRPWTGPWTRPRTFMERPRTVCGRYHSSAQVWMDVSGDTCEVTFIHVH